MQTWHAFLTRARSEKKVAERLSLKGVTTYLPLIPRERQWADRKTVVEWPVFPSYLFCRIDPGDLLRVLQTPGIATVVKLADDPAVIRDEEMENVRCLVEGLVSTGQEPEPTPVFSVGQPVRVLAGPFEGVTGRVREVRGRKRLLVGIHEIGQGLEVDIGAHALEPGD